MPSTAMLAVPLVGAGPRPPPAAPRRSGRSAAQRLPGLVALATEVVHLRLHRGEPGRGRGRLPSRSRAASAASRSRSAAACRQELRRLGRARSRYPLASARSRRAWPPAAAADGDSLISRALRSRASASVRASATIRSASSRPRLGHRGRLVGGQPEHLLHPLGDREHLRRPTRARRPAADARSRARPRRRRTGLSRWSTSRRASTAPPRPRPRSCPPGAGRSRSRRLRKTGRWLSSSSRSPPDWRRGHADAGSAPRPSLRPPSADPWIPLLHAEPPPTPGQCQMPDRAEHVS